jgi:hypothetical protein
VSPLLPAEDKEELRTVMAHLEAASPGNGGRYGNGPSLTDIARRLQRIEDRMDMRVVAPEVFDAYKATISVTVTAIEHRLAALERAQSAAVKLVATALVGLIGQAVFVVVALVGKGGS